MEKPTPWVFILFSLAMGIVIMAFPYIVTLFNHFNRERLVVWRKFLIIISVCYIPLIVLLYTICIISPDDIGLKISFPLLKGYYFVLVYYFGYIMFTILVKKRINLQFGWFKFIIFATAGYLTITILLAFISALFDDPLISLFAGSGVNYITPP